MIPQGEWKVSEGYLSTFIFDAKGNVVAEVRRGVNETACARARLMAAAPKMAALLADYCVAHTAMARYLFADLSNSKQCQCDLCQRWRALLARIEEEEG